MTYNRERVIVAETPGGIETRLRTDADGNLATVDQRGVPTNYTAWMGFSRNVPLNAGQLNKVRIRPAIMNEHSESSNEILGTVASGTIVGQIFRASLDNIYGVMLTLESAEAETTIDDIEQANDSALQSAWVKTGTNEAVLETTIVSPNQSSTKSMKLDMDTLNDKWTFDKATGSWDMTGATIELDYYQTAITTSAAMTLSINDGADTSVITLAIGTGLTNAWQHFSIPVASMTGTADVSAIENIFLQVTNRQPGQFAYADNVRFRAEPGSIEVKLWDCGSTEPVGDGASFDLATDGTQYTEIGDRGIAGSVAASLVFPLDGGKRLYHIEDFVAGAAKEIPANTLLTVGNYYALTLHHVDTDVSVFGPDTTLSIDYYTSGYAFSTTAENVDITKINGAAGSGDYSDLAFSILSTQAVYISSIQVSFLDSSGALVSSDLGTNVIILLEDDNMSSVFWSERHGTGTGFELVIGRSVALADGGKSEAYVNLAIDDPAFAVAFVTNYYFVPPTAYG